ncbi:hypothetical protein FE251_11910 [Georgenia wutianyii]|uniref:DUF6318 domain-containing protein n=1 Tax=Georgenia wutianyii TaxID=2585135 RepID=A0ABX5VQV9_9MICO|nr:DUF6318 family protein [Georgenia wutianyii]QDB80006.1 hypothetical protein FE251_11910 [Georgenia wutianyii]
MRTWSVRRLAVAACVAGLFATGCSGDGEPEPSGTTPVTAEPSDPPGSVKPTSPAPGPTPWPEPTRPAAMDRDDIEGAKAAAQYFLELYPYVYATGDLDEWRAMSGPECQFCEGAAERATELFSAGGYGVGGEIAVLEIGAAPPDDDWEHFRVGVDGVESPSVEYSGNGEVLRTIAGGAVTYNLALLRSEGGWVVRGVNLQEGQSGS